MTATETGTARGTDPAPLLGERWIVIAEEDLLPATTGCRVDHLGFIEAALRAGVEVFLIVPARHAFDQAAYANAFPGATVMAIARDERSVRHLSMAPYVVASRPVPADLLATVQREFPEPTAVISYSVRVAHLGLMFAQRLGLPHLVRCQNLDSAYFRDIAASAPPVRKVAYLVEAAKLRRFERTLNNSALVSAFADVSSEEAQAHRQRTEHPVLHVPSFALSSVATDGAETATDPARDGVVFVGSLDVETNQLAVEWLLDHVWPTVQRDRPGTTLQIVGRAPSAALRERVLAASDQQVELHADVASVSPYLRAAAICVNPVRTGAGINVKLLQGMAAGCAAVSTSVGAVGLDWVPGRDLIVTDDAADFADAIVGLLADPSARGAIAQRGATFVTDRLDPLRGVQAFAGTLGRRAAS